MGYSFRCGADYVRALLSEGEVNRAWDFVLKTYQPSEEVSKMPPCTCKGFFGLAISSDRQVSAFLCSVLRPFRSVVM